MITRISDLALLEEKLCDDNTWRNKLWNVLIDKMKKKPVVKDWNQNTIYENTTNPVYGWKDVLMTKGHRPLVMWCVCVMKLIENTSFSETNTTSCGLEMVSVPFCEIYGQKSQAKDNLLCWLGKNLKQWLKFDIKVRIFRKNPKNIKQS